MSGGALGGNNPHKIKGGKWTVFRFFLVAIAHSVGWFTVSSLLGYYAKLYGPQILLLMNIFYYLPSIPLLLLSAVCDDALDRAFGEPPCLVFMLVSAVRHTGCLSPLSHMFRECRNEGHCSCSQSLQALLTGLPCARQACPGSSWHGCCWAWAAARSSARSSPSSSAPSGEPRRRTSANCMLAWPHAPGTACRLPHQGTLISR